MRFAGHNSERPSQAKVAPRLKAYVQYWECAAVDYDQ